MPICSYLVIAQSGEADALGDRLESLRGCEVVRSTNRDVLLLVTETGTAAEERSLRRAIEDLPGLHSLALTFGEIDPQGGEAGERASATTPDRRSGASP